MEAKLIAVLTVRRSEGAGNGTGDGTGAALVGIDMGEGTSACACSGAGGKQPPKLREFSACSVQEVRALEDAAVAEGTSLAELMDRAGAALARGVASRMPVGRKVLVLCGSGNNGGDGWVAARLLAQAGFCVCVQALRAPADISVQPARDAAERAVAGAIECASAGAGIAAGADGGVIPGVRAYRFQEASFGFEDCDCIVDCLLGIGFDGETVREPGRSLILQANAARAHRIACDVPSGMNADTGIAADVCFAADATVTMLAVKRGLIAHGSAGRVGDLFLAELNLPE